LLQQLREQGITQTAFAESIGTSSKRLSAVKRSELRNRFHSELGALKLASLWLLDHHSEFTPAKKGSKR
jgi:transcriptional regulator